MSEEVESSEFGKGYSYCLGLFLAHEWKMFDMSRKNKENPSHGYDASLWFNGAADHLFELEIPATLPDSKKKQIESFKDRCLKFRLCMNGEKCTYEDAEAALNEAKDLLREWDALNGVPTMKGSWQ